jgi:hypothetical protein
MAGVYNATALMQYRTCCYQHLARSLSLSLALSLLLAFCCYSGLFGFLLAVWNNGL